MSTKAHRDLIAQMRIERNRYAEEQEGNHPFSNHFIVLSATTGVDWTLVSFGKVGKIWSCYDVKIAASYHTGMKQPNTTFHDTARYHRVLDEFNNTYDFRMDDFTGIWLCHAPGRSINGVSYSGEWSR